MATIKQLTAKKETIVAQIANLNDKLVDKKEALKAVNADLKAAEKDEKAKNKAAKSK